MKRHTNDARRIVAVVALLLAGAPAAAQDAWIDIEAEGFVAAFPGPPDIARTPEIPPGNEFGHRYLLVMSSASLSIEVSQNVRTPPADSDLAQGEVELVFRDCTIREDVTIDGPLAPVRSVVGDCQGEVVRAKVAKTDTHFYTVVARAGTGDDTPDLSRFVDSFGLVAGEPEWATFEVADPGLSVEVPGRLTRVGGSLGVDQPPRYRLFYREGGFEVFSGPLPPELAGLAPAEVLEQMTSRPSGNCERLPVIEVPFPEGAALEVTEICRGRHDRGRAYVAGGVFYGVLTSGTEAFVRSADADRFLSSFRLIRR